MDAVIEEIRKRIEQVERMAGVPVRSWEADAKPAQPEKPPARRGGRRKAQTEEAAG